MGSTTLLEHLKRCLAELEAKIKRTQEDEDEIAAIKKQIQEIECTQ